tara:strand:- start:2348 stop:3373 length:1026 start_codon:yes stop_codon:yes gene_type:complete
MEELIIITISFLFFIFFNNFLIKKEFLLNYSGSAHQKFSGITNVPLTGGIFIFFSILYLYFSEIESIVYLFSLLFILGLATDLKITVSPKIRFLIQTVLLFLIVYSSDLRITATRVYLIDLIISNVLLSYFFSTFCLLILINGSNFIDGLNGLLVGYYLLISIVFYQLDFINFLNNGNNNSLFFLVILFVLFLLNLFKKSFMGDTGAYILGFFYGYLLIKIYVEYQIFSPFFVILLLWYPCFENLFSIFRKFQLKKSPIKPDNNHLHQLIFFYLKKKYKYKSIYANNYGALSILLYNLIVFSFGTQNISNTQYQIILLLLNILIYCAVYFKLFAYKYKLKV